MIIHYAHNQITDHRSQITDNISDTFRLDAVQGSQDERASRTSSTVSERETPANAVMRQESWQSSELCSEAGQDGGGVR